MKIRRSTLYFALAMAVAYVLLGYEIFFHSGNIFNQSIPSKSGVLDLTKVQMDAETVFRIEGDAEFYWEKLLAPGDFASPKKPPMTGYIKIPGVWNGYTANGKELTGNGYATYRLTVKVPDNGRYGIRIKEFDCAYRLWANGREVSAGKVGTSKEEMEPSWQRREVFFDVTDRSIDLVFQVSNFHHRKGGAEDLMLLGKAQSILSYKRSQQAISYFLVGIFLIMAFHYFGLFVFRPNDKSSLNFALINVAILLRLATTNEKIFAELFPFIDWEIQIRIEYLAYMMPLPLFYNFFRSLYPTLFPKYLLNTIYVLAALTAAVVVLAPVQIFTYTPLFYQMLIMAFTVYFMYKLIVAVAAGMEDAHIILNGYLFIFAVAVNDFLYYNRIIDTDFFLPMGLFVMVFTQSFVLSRRYAKSFTSVERLSRQLEGYTQELEATVEARTHEVVAQKNEIEQQARSLEATNAKLTELGKFKESMTHMIVHDLKNPLNTIINAAFLDDIPDKDKLIHEAGREMNTLVMNLLDVYKYENTSMLLHKEPVDLMQMIEDAIDDVSFLGSTKSVSFVTNGLSHGPLLADKAIMLRVLVNLLTNAIKFSPLAGTVEVNVVPRPDRTVSVSVRDHGPGISAERQTTIFDRYQGKPQRNEILYSTGLGLSFCKLAIEAHHGQIELLSQDMKGCLFTVSLPLSDGPAPDLTAAPPPARAQKNSPTANEVLTQQETQTLRPFAEQLTAHEVFEVSDIFRILEKTAQLQSPRIDQWAANVRNAVLRCNQDQYTQLLNNVINEQH